MEALALEEKPEDRMEAYKLSGNEAWKLAQALHLDADKAEAQLPPLQLRLSSPPTPLSPSDRRSLTADISRLEDKVQRQRAAYQRKLQDAYVYYSHAIALEVSFLPLLASSILSNRALVSLALHNYGRALSDARLACQKDPNNAKAWYRGATALLRLHRPHLALDFIRSALASRRLARSEAAALHTLKGEAEAAQAAEEAKQRRRAEAAAAAAKAAEGGEAGGSERRWRRSLPPSPNAASPSALPSSAPLTAAPAPTTCPRGRRRRRRRLRRRTEGGSRCLEDGALSFPLTFMYPQHGQSDHIEQWHELSPVGGALGLLFPPGAAAPEWDRGRGV